MLNGQIHSLDHVLNKCLFTKVSSKNSSDWHYVFNCPLIMDITFHLEVKFWCVTCSENRNVMPCFEKSYIKSNYVVRLLKASGKLWITKTEKHFANINMIFKSTLCKYKINFTQNKDNYIHFQLNAIVSYICVKIMNINFHS